ncbi:hypothetical protein [Streptococcus hyointestinalis]
MASNFVLSLIKLILELINMTKK